MSNDTIANLIENYQEWSIPHIIEVCSLILVGLMNIYQTKKLYGDSSCELDCFGKEVIQIKKSISPLNSEEELEIKIEK